MKRLIRWAVGLYPPAWRRRYQEEFEALLEDLPASPRVFWNTLTGALAMQFQSLGKPAAVCALLGAVLAGGASFGFKDEFRATAVMQLSTPPGERDERLRAAVQETLSRRSLAEIFQRDQLSWGEEKKQTLADVVERRRKKISVSVRPIGGRNYLAIEVQHEHINVGQAIALGVAASVREAYKGSWDNNRIYVQPGSPEKPVFPNRRNFALAGLASGCIAGVAFGLVQQHRKQLL